MDIINHDFIERMKALIPNEIDDFLKSYDFEKYRGLRINSLKIGVDDFKKICDFKLYETPFAEEAFYISNEEKSVGKNPFHHAGMFYVQEPSATSAVEVLAPEPNDYVLDLCAAPGGKSTQIAAKLRGKGLLISNEFVQSRAKILLSNIERMGIKNAVVTSNYPDLICGKLSGFFNKILVDAPCSGEGMFKKEPKAIENWSIENVKTCAARQLAILNSAKNALCEDGIMVYSTCTFSVEENEETIFKFLEQNLNFELLDCGVTFGRPSSALNINGDKTQLHKMRRILPMDKGEGHFVAKLKKHSYQSVCKDYCYKKTNETELKAFFDFYNANFEGVPQNVQAIGENVYILPAHLPNLDGINVLRAGVFAGRIKQNRFEPEHHLYMSMKKDDLKRYVNFDRNDADILKYLRGEQIEIKNEMPNGYCGVLVNNVSTGFGKIVDDTIKNHYPKGLRNV